MEIPLIVQNDQYLKPYENKIRERQKKFQDKEFELTGGNPLKEFANGYNFYGIHKTNTGWIYRDWLPNAEKVYLIGEFTSWKLYEYFKLQAIGNGNFELEIPQEKIKHGDLYRLHVIWPKGSGDRIPAYSKRVVQDENTKIFNAQIWSPPKPYKFKYKSPKGNKPLFIYEAHIGMSSEEGRVSSFNEFRENILPRIIDLGYNTIQLMAIQEHPYYGSFGYHVSNFFAASSRFGTPEDLKMLIDVAHKNEIRVIMDVVHSHAVKNEVEGISKYDGSEYQFFHEGDRGQHPAWDSRCFNYEKNEVLHFLLSNCKFWLEEYDFDGFRFDGVTSMLYENHGLGTAFTSYDQYFNEELDEDAICYLSLTNKLIHEVKPEAITIAEEMSGMPGMASPVSDGGIGFDFRLAMGVPDFWIKLLKETKDEDWHVGDIFYNLTNKRDDEQVVSYAESHDQALVGDKTLIFRLADKEMYYCMSVDKINIEVERAIAMHKVIRLLTASTAGGAYLNFMGNEFGHPEWVDFPREGNNWSYHYARRQWSLSDNPELGYFYLKEFDKDMIRVLKLHDVLANDKIISIVQNNYDMVLIFKRAELFFIFNLNPFVSFTEYGFETEKGEYEIILNSDNSKYLGQKRIDENMLYKTSFNKENGKHILKLYIPGRTTFIMRKLNVNIKTGELE